MKLAFALLLAAGACGGAHAPPAAPAPAPPAPPAPAPPSAAASQCAALDAPFQNIADNLRKQITPEMDERLVKIIRATADAEPKSAAIACPQDAWTAEQIKCYVDARTVGAWNLCDEGLSGPQRVNFDLYVRAFSDDSGATAAWPWQPVAASTGAPACDDYLRSVDTFMACARVPEPSRKAAAGIFHSLADQVRAHPDGGACESIRGEVTKDLTRAGC